MSVEQVRAYLAPFGLDGRVQEFAVSSATVELAAMAVGVAPAHIAKTLSFRSANAQAPRQEGNSQEAPSTGPDGGCLLIVTAGDAKIDNVKFKAYFHTKAKMLTAEEALSMTGHAVGGVCPFAIDPAIPVYLDVSMRRFDTVFPACGSASSAIELTGDELFRCANALDWVDVCKGWQEEA